MLKKEMEQKILEYEEVLKEIGRWCFPQQYKLDELLPKNKLLFHIRGIKEVLEEKFYKLK